MSDRLQKEPGKSLSKLHRKLTAVWHGRECMISEQVALCYLLDPKDALIINNALWDNLRIWNSNNFKETTPFKCNNGLKSKL